MLNDLLERLYFGDSLHAPPLLHTYEIQKFSSFAANAQLLALCIVPHCDSSWLTDLANLANQQEEIWLVYILHTYIVAPAASLMCRECREDACKYFTVQYT